ncbi:MAG: histidine triad nucleotide-binding protein [Campylobacteraceae bacterium 4484_166]|nr:MAG: histidine triad nucleotide-binding protein [Campylobacteraceae bacterium 4484_166]
MCLFCKIVDGDIPSKKIYEDDEFLCFEDINRLSKIHILIIPKKHIESFEDILPQTMANMTKTIQTITKKLDINKSGYRLITNIAKDGGQEVKHLHFHLLSGEKLGAMYKK